MAFPKEIELALQDAIAPDAGSGSGLVWKRPLANRVKAGSVAGTLGKDGYWSVQVKGKKLAAHRVLWWLVNGEIPPGLCIDHIDGNRGNNRLDNLRLATRSQNNQNSRPRRNSSKLPKGISRAGRGYRAQVQGNGVRWRLSGDDLSVLIPAVKAIRRMLHNDFCCYR
ncbi:HNH endonuclease [Serratia rubidaea]|nr:HNH endonuclease [Serratia rubidaea]